jgi:energy-coupling factor transporter ATP-binding protein EcfA2
MSSRPVTRDPQPPDELLEVLRAGECVLFAGAGLSARAGLPLWHELVQRLSGWAVDKGLIEAEWARVNEQAIAAGRSGEVADGIVAAARERGVDLQEFLAGIYSRPRSPADVSTALRALPFGAAFTTNFDDLLERYFERRSRLHFTPLDADALQVALHKREFFVLKLFGDLHRPGSLMISPSQFDDAVRENLPFARFMESVFVSRSLLFLGASLEGIGAYLRGVGLRPQASRRHFALVAGGADGQWRSAAFSLEKRYNIEFIAYEPDREHRAVVRFLGHLVHASRRVPAAQGDGDAQAGPALRRLRLDGIGAFEQMEFDFHPQWTIVLGDNGVGKSTILKAIATAICGPDGREYAARMVRPGRTASNIVLETTRGTYATHVLLSPSGPAEVRAPAGRPADAEGWLTVGFPALRSLSWDRPKAPERLIRQLPSPDDVLPLVRGGPDPRLDRLKQWIVNLDYLSKDEQTRGGGGDRYERLMNHFFQLTGSLIEGVRVERGTVRPESFEVTVHTDDGEVPIEALSQGTSSLMGWVGIVLQRLYEVYGEDEDPTQRYVLVLIDELDAHLHPAWQQTLAQKLTSIFPNAQFIATTHSPLIVGGMTPEQVILLVRDDDGIVQRQEVTREMTLGRADQLLTGELFGLRSTLDVATQGKLQRYTQLLGRTRRTEEEEREFQDLTEQLRTRIPPSAESAEARKEVLRIQEDVARLSAAAPA